MVREAFGIWQSYSYLQFVERPDSSSYASATDIRIGFAHLSTAQQRASGRSYTVGIEYSRTVGGYYAPDALVAFQDPSDVPLMSVSGTYTYKDGVTLLQDALHEIGHALGLDHSSAASDVMYATLGASNRSVSGNDIAGIQAVYGNPKAGLISTLNFDQQMELIYIGYFNRAADTAGFTFWADQNRSAQSRGQGVADALKNISNAFTPQRETQALYSFLANGSARNASQSAIGSFVDAAYANLFARTPDATGRTYWTTQISTGAVALGEAVLSVANGAVGSDATLLQNKITVALDFTTRTGAARLGLEASLPQSFLTAAKSVLVGVDGASINDASVTNAKARTTTYITSGPRDAGVEPGLGDAWSDDVAALLASEPPMVFAQTVAEPGQVLAFGDADPGAVFEDPALAIDIEHSHGAVVAGADAWDEPAPFAYAETAPPPAADTVLIPLREA